MKSTIKYGVGSNAYFGVLEATAICKLVSWLYSEKDRTWEEFLGLSNVEQYSIIAEFENSNQN